MSSSVVKIVLGLVQVISKQPEVLKEDYPGIMWDSDWLKVFSFDFGWVVRSECVSLAMAHGCMAAANHCMPLRVAMCAQVPVCEVTYLTRFILNAIVLPASLILLVAGTWTANTRERSWHRQLCLRSQFRNADKAKDDANAPVATDNEYDEQQASKYSDYYFAVFLCCESRTLSQPSHGDLLVLLANCIQSQARYQSVSLRCGCVLCRVSRPNDDTGANSDYE